MTLHLVYRSYGGENTKRRPPYYSKLLTLLSFIRAAERVPDADVVFVNDGPIPEDRLHLMTGAGSVISMGDTAAGMRASYVFALDLPDREGWAADDVVMFVEDDYLFTADAFVALTSAIDDPSIDYFSLYGERPDTTSIEDRREFAVPAGWHPQPEVVIERADLVQPAEHHQHLRSPGRGPTGRPGHLRAVHAAVPAPLPRSRDLPDGPGRDSVPRVGTRVGVAG